MRILTSQDAVDLTPEGGDPGVRAVDFIQDEDLVCGLRTIAARTNVPRRSGQGASSRYLVYVVRGSATVSNGEYYEKIQPGCFVLFDAGEVPRYQTSDQELQVLEIAWTQGVAAKPLPHPLGVEPNGRTPPETNKARGGVYMEI